MTASAERAHSGRRGPGWFTALIVYTLIVHAAYNGLRVLISYRTLELGGGAGVLGLVTATYSLAPLLAAIPIGRWVDRGYAMPVMWIGTVLTILPAAGAAWSPGVAVLLAANMALGMGQVLTTVSGQALIPQSFAQSDLNRRFGTLTVGVSAGQAVGVPVAGLIAGTGGADAHVQPAMWAMAGIAALAVPAMVGITRRPAVRHVPRLSLIHI